MPLVESCQGHLGHLLTELTLEYKRQLYGIVWVGGDWVYGCRTNAV